MRAAPSGHLILAFPPYLPAQYRSCCSRLNVESSSCCSPHHVACFAFRRALRSCGQNRKCVQEVSDRPGSRHSAIGSRHSRAIGSRHSRDDVRRELTRARREKLPCGRRSMHAAPLLCWAALPLLGSLATVAPTSPHDGDEPQQHADRRLQSSTGCLPRDSFTPIGFDVRAQPACYACANRVATLLCCFAAERSFARLVSRLSPYRSPSSSAATLAAREADAALQACARRCTRRARPRSSTFRPSALRGPRCRTKPSTCA